MTRERVRLDEPKRDPVRVDVLDETGEVVGRLVAADEHGNGRGQSKVWFGPIDGKKEEFRNLSEISIFTRAKGYSFQKLYPDDLEKEAVAVATKVVTETRLVWLAWRRVTARLGPPSHELMAGILPVAIATVGEKLGQKDKPTEYFVAMHVPGYKKDITRGTLEEAKALAEVLVRRWLVKVVEQDPKVTWKSDD